MKGRRRTQRQRRKTIRRRGGSIHALPLTESTGAEFKAAWSLNYIGSHGYTVEREFKIPPDTYLLFVAPSGEQCGINKADEDRLFASLILSRRFATEEAFWDAWLAVVKGVAPSRNFGFELYNKTKPEPLMDAPKTVAIFEPGEMVKDQYLNFANDDVASLFIDMGVYNLPLQPDHLETVDRIRNMIKTRYTQPSGNIHMRNIPAIAALYQEGTVAYQRRADNLLKVPVGEVMLSSILENPRSMGISFQAGKKRIFVINACRTPADESVPKRRHRRNSLAKRKYEAAPAPVVAPVVAPVAAPAPKPAEAGPKPAAAKPKVSGFKKGFLL
jgi:hypothetical protein